MTWKVFLLSDFLVSKICDFFYLLLTYRSPQEVIGAVMGPQGKRKVIWVVTPLDTIRK